MIIGQDQRQHPRIDVALAARFRLADGSEHDGRTRNLSVGGSALAFACPASNGQDVVAYISDIGRIQGTVVRNFDGGFAIAHHHTVRQQERLANRLMWILNRDGGEAADQRRHRRVPLALTGTNMRLADGTAHECRVLDMSLSGAAVEIEADVPLGTDVQLGRSRARVVRQFGGGVGVEFLDVDESGHTLADHIVH